MLIDEDLLLAMGVDVRRVSDREIQAICPVHHLVVGRADTRPSWYMNRSTGAWLCFSCNQRGSLSHLGELMEIDPELLEDLPAQLMQEALRRQEEDEEDEAGPAVYVSEYGFSKNPYPHKAIRQLRDIRKDACVAHNVRWSTEGRCFLIPLYTIEEGKLVGWQEKAKGYFMNVPDEVPKRLCLFGLQQYVRGDMIVVESPLDVVRMTSYGIHGGVATMGSYVSNEQIDGMANALSPTGKLILAFDNDKAGDEACHSVNDRLERIDRVKHIRFFHYPGPAEKFGKDIGELRIEHVHAGIAKAQGKYQVSHA